jgi:hypothetical protein
MVNLAIMAIVVALMFLATTCFVRLHTKWATVLALCGLAIFGCGVLRDTLNPPQGKTLIVAR